MVRQKEHAVDERSKLLDGETTLGEGGPSNTIHQKTVDAQMRTRGTQRCAVRSQLLLR